MLDRRPKKRFHESLAGTFGPGDICSWHRLPASPQNGPTVGPGVDGFRVQLAALRIRPLMDRPRYVNARENDASSYLYGDAARAVTSLSI